MQVIVASKNPLKIKAVENAFRKVFPDKELEFISRKTESGVSPTPWNDDLRNGAKNRVSQVANSGEHYDYIVAIEAGINEYRGRCYLASYVFIRHRTLPKDVKSDSFSSVLELPLNVISELRAGRGLGSIANELSGEENSKQKFGIDGILTDRLITRGVPEEMAVIHALGKFLHPEYWKK
jgi:inosine/xanthosine triphosphatase